MARRPRGQIGLTHERRDGVFSHFIACGFINQPAHKCVGIEETARVSR
jgi:hypothetical protein